MGYQQRARSPGGFGRGRGIPKHEKAKTRGQKHRPAGIYGSEEKHVPTSEEIADRTLKTLHNLGNQRFVLSPFSEQLNHWLVNLKDTMSEFESSADVTVDDQFVKERTQILAEIELALEKRRCKEASFGEIAKNLSDNRALLERIEEEYSAATNEIDRQKHAEIKRLSNSVDSIKQELDRLGRMKTGIFGSISKKNKAQKETEATRRLNETQDKLTTATQHFNSEQEKLRDEYSKRKQVASGQIQHLEKEVASQEVDGSLEDRRIVCEALASTVNSFLQRKGLKHQ